MSRGVSQPKPWRVIFLGTPEFAVPSLNSLVAAGHVIPLVVTQPDRPRGRGRKLSPPPVKEAALELGLGVWQPDSVKGGEAEKRLKELAPDALAVVAYGGILPPGLLNLTDPGPINVHPSLLPAYRGPAPINWALIKGEKVTGVTTMVLDRGVDTGPLLLSRRVKIGPDETAGELHDRLAEIGAELLVETLAGLKAGTLVSEPQPAAGVSQGRLLEKSDGLLDWARPARELAAQVRGLDPWPGAHTIFKDKTVKLFGARPGPGQGKPGQILALDGDRLHVAAGRGSLAVAELQAAGRKRQTAREFWHGQRLSQDDFFGQ